MNRTKKICLLWGGLGLLLVVILVFVNRVGTRTEEELYRASELEVSYGSRTVILDEKTLSGLSTEVFEATYRRKVGPPEDRSYTGISLPTLLAAAGISAEDAGSIGIVSLDQYRIELPLEEALNPGNVYIVSRQDGAALSGEEGPYLLVIRDDALSTRWVKQVVRLEAVD